MLIRRFRNDLWSKVGVKINGAIVTWKKNVKYVGNFISHNLSDSEDVVLKTATFISQVNMLNNKLSKISSLVVRGRLIQTYCCSWYGSQTRECTRVLCKMEYYLKHENKLNENKVLS